MGHNAQYQKRGSTPVGPVFPLLPPQSDEWSQQLSGTNYQVKRLVAWPAGAASLLTQFKPPGGAWENATTVVLLDTWTTIKGGVPAGDNSSRTRWAAAGPEYTPLSRHSASKPQLFP
jgi:hypothetical protein